MSFGNGGGADTSALSNMDFGNGGFTDTGFGNIGDNFYSSTGFENVPLQGMNTDGNGFQILNFLGNNNGEGGEILNQGVNGGWFNTLGRLGAGILGGLGGYESSANQQPYLPYTQWLGNGLAKFSAINNTDNKKTQQNKAYANALKISSLFGPGKSLLGRFGGQLGRIYNDDVETVD